MTVDSVRLLAAGIIWFSVLTLTYEQFYGPLGVGVNDLGLSYINLLTGSVGTAFALALATLIYSTLILGLLSAIGVVVPGLKRTTAKVGRYRVVACVLIVLATVLSFVFLPIAAISSRADVMAGRRVEPARLQPLPISILSLRADRVRISPQTERENPFLEDLADRQLVYLGQNEGKLVLFDIKLRRPVYVPGNESALFILP